MQIILSFFGSLRATTITLYEQSKMLRPATLNEFFVSTVPLFCFWYNEWHRTSVTNNRNGMMKPWNITNTREYNQQSPIMDVNFHSYKNVIKVHLNNKQPILTLISVFYYQFCEIFQFLKKENCERLLQLVYRIS